jgi:hypothetical protein
MVDHKKKVSISTVLDQSGKVKTCVRWKVALLCIHNNSTMLTSSVLICIPDGVVRAQGWLKGHVEIETKDQGIPSGQVLVKLVGKETVCSLSHNTQSEHVVFEESITNMPKVPADQDFLEPGKVHECPFSMYLPGNIPPSLLYKDKEHLEGCSVNYHLAAEFDSYPCSVREVSIVGQPLSNKLYPAQVGPTVLPLTKQPTSVSSWMNMWTNNDNSHPHIGAMGSIVLAAKVGNTHIGKGQVLKFSTAVRNRSSMLDIESIQATIVERITSKRCDSTCLASVNCAGIPTLHYKKQEQPASSPKTDTTMQVDDVLSSEMQAEMASPRNTLELKVPLNARDSYAGKLIQVSHHLVITAIMSAAPVSANTNHPAPYCCHVEIPIQVFDPPVESHSSHSLTSSGTLDSTVVNLATTVWPEESTSPKSHERHRSDSACSFSSIKEEPPSEAACQRNTNEG